MNFSEKKKQALLALYQKRFDGRYYDIAELLEEIQIEVTNSESYHIGQSLEEDGFMKVYPSKDGSFGEITADGVEYIEEGLFNNYKTDFSEEEIIITNDKLDQLIEQLHKLELGQEITYEDLTAEINELRELVYTLKKKTWFETLKGKMITIGLGQLTEKGFSLIERIFEGTKFLNQ